MDPNHYEFRTTWNVVAPRERVLDLLVRVESYVEWWPEVRRVTALGDDRAEFVIRSFLPYDLTFVGARVADTALRHPELTVGCDVLELAMQGDLEGFSRFIVPAGEMVDHVVFEETVVVRKALLRRFARVGRPAFAANHRRMMRRGEAGLQARLATRP